MRASDEVRVSDREMVHLTNAGLGFVGVRPVDVIIVAGHPAMVSSHVVRRSCRVDHVLHITRLVGQRKVVGPGACGRQYSYPAVIAAATSPFRSSRRPSAAVWSNIASAWKLIERCSARRWMTPVSTRPARRSLIIGPTAGHSRTGENFMVGVFMVRMWLC